jgi:redox-sensitive bicupin YhaK (pirin superfamily)
VRGIAPSYEQKTVPEAAKRGQLALVAAPEAGEHTVQIHADARLYAGLLDGAEQATLALDAQRKAYVFVVRGSLRANGQTLNAGDAAMLAAESALTLDQAQDAEVLVFDLAP